jgi:hypothetical protein
LVEEGDVLDEAINMAKQIMKSPEYAVSQLLQVNNLLIDQVKTFDIEIESIVKSMGKILGI